MKLSEIFPWAIPVEIRYFRAKSEVWGSRYRDCTKSTLATIFEVFKKSQNLKSILDKSLLNEKVVFLHKNNSFLGFILRGVLAKNFIFWDFRLDPMSVQRPMWLPYTSNEAQKGLKASRIAKRNLSESFVELTLTVWKLWPEKWQWGLMSASTPFWDHCA